MGCDNKMSYLSFISLYSYCNFTKEQAAVLIFIAVSREYVNLTQTNLRLSNFERVELLTVIIH